MTRYINLCRSSPKQEVQPKPQDDDEPTRYEIYKQSYEFYNNTDKRKEFMKEYNKNYRITHSNQIECECGITYKDISKYAHMRSKRHKRFIETKTGVNT